MGARARVAQVAAGAVTCQRQGRGRSRLGRSQLRGHRLRERTSAARKAGADGRHPRPAAPRPCIVTASAAAAPRPRRRGRSAARQFARDAHARPGLAQRSCLGSFGERQMRRVGRSRRVRATTKRPSSRGQIVPSAGGPIEIACGPRSRPPRRPPHESVIAVRGCERRTSTRSARRPCEPSWGHSASISSFHIALAILARPRPSSAGALSRSASPVTAAGIMDIALRRYAARRRQGARRRAWTTSKLGCRQERSRRRSRFASLAISSRGIRSRCSCRTLQTIAGSACRDAIAPLPARLASWPRAQSAIRLIRRGPPT